MFLVVDGHNTLILLIIFFNVVLWIEPDASHMLGK